MILFVPNANMHTVALCVDDWRQQLRAVTSADELGDGGRILTCVVL
jgi:hypothetical protein